MLDVAVLTDPEEFFGLAAPLLQASPAEHTIIGTVLDDVRVGAREHPGAQWMAVRDGTTVLGLSMWTPPFAPYLGPMPAEAADAVADALADASDSLPGLNGDVDAVRTALARYQRRHPGTSIEDTTQMRLYELGRLIHPASVPGAARTASADDYDLLLRWYRAFADDIGHPADRIVNGMRIRLEREALVLWEVDGQPVSMAGHTAPVAGVARVGPVYTPTELRGRGYGSAVTAQASQRAGAHAGSVVLFTDLGNPTSNKIYTEIGYRGVRDYLEVTLAV